MAYRTRLTVSTEIRENIEGIRAQTQDRRRFDASVKRCAANLATFIEGNGNGPDSGMLAPRCVELMYHVLAEIRAYFKSLQEGLDDAFKADDTKILGSKEIELAEGLIRIAEERGRTLDAFLDNLNSELIKIIYLQFSQGRWLDEIDQFIRVAEEVEKAKTELLTF